MTSDEGRESRAVEEEGVERPESSGEGIFSDIDEELSDERRVAWVECLGIYCAGRWSLDARDHLALRSQGLGEAGFAAEGF